MSANFDDFDDVEVDENFSENSNSQIQVAVCEHNIDLQEEEENISSPNIQHSERENSNKNISREFFKKDNSKISEISCKSNITQQFHLIKTREVNNLLKEYEEIYHTRIRPAQFLLEENKLEIQAKEREIEFEIENEFKEIINRIEEKKGEIIQLSKSKFASLLSHLSCYSSHLNQNDAVIQERINVLNSFKTFQASTPQKQEQFVKEFCEFKSLLEDPDLVRTEVSKIIGKLKKVTVGVNFEGLLQHVEEIGLVKIDVENLKSSFQEIKQSLEGNFTTKRHENPFKDVFIPPWKNANNYHYPSNIKSKRANFLQNENRNSSPLSTNFISPSKVSTSFERNSAASSFSKNSKIETRLKEQQNSFNKIMRSYRTVLDEIRISSRKSVSIRRRL